MMCVLQVATWRYVLPFAKPKNMQLFLFVYQCVWSLKCQHLQVNSGSQWERRQILTDFMFVPVAYSPTVVVLPSVVPRIRLTVYLHSVYCFTFYLEVVYRLKKLTNKENGHSSISFTSIVHLQIECIKQYTVWIINMRLRHWLENGIHWKYVVWDQLDTQPKRSLLWVDGFQKTGWGTRQ